MNSDHIKKDEECGACRSVSSFQKLNRIGEGTYGMVYRALDRKSNTIVALKRIILHNESKDGFPLTTIREIATLRRIKHPNCVMLLEVAVGRKRDGVFLVFEYCEHDLASLIDNIREPFTESEIKRLILQLLSAVQYLHEHWIIHRDIKLSNLLYNNRGEMKLADFGLARTYSQPLDIMTQKVVTLWYRAPELLLGSAEYSTAIDIWAIGCIHGELLKHTPLLPGNNEIEQIQKIFDLLGYPNSRIWPDLEKLPLIRNKMVKLKTQSEFGYNNLNQQMSMLSELGNNLLNLMLTYDPNKRITAKNAIRHEYFDTSPYPKESELMPTFPTRHTKDGDPYSEIPTAKDSLGGSGFILPYKYAEMKNSIDIQIEKGYNNSHDIEYSGSTSIISSSGSSNGTHLVSSTQDVLFSNKISSGYGST
eukprot:gene8575-17685_t